MHHPPGLWRPDGLRKTLLVLGMTKLHPADRLAEAYSPSRKGTGGYMRAGLIWKQAEMPGQ
jgi:hypothetical protein